MFNRRQKKFREYLGKFLNSPDGKYVAKVLKEDYIGRTALGDTPERTAYMLGQKEFAQSLLDLVNESEELNEINTINDLSME